MFTIKMSYLKAFTNQFMNLVNELHELFPNDNEISSSADAVELLKKTNPRMLFSIFMDHIYPFKTEILKKNVDFFMVPENIKSSNKFIKTINKLRLYWNTLTENTQNTIWLYFQVMIKLAERILNQTDQTTSYRVI